MKYEITLVITVNETHPRKWDWGSLLDLRSGESIDYMNIEEVK